MIFFPFFGGWITFKTIVYLQQMANSLKKTWKIEKKYNAGDHHSSIINISVSLCSTLSRKTKQKAIGRKKPTYQSIPLKHLLGVKLSDVKENSRL